MKKYEIITKVQDAGRCTFLTKARNVRAALRNLVNRSGDFKYISENYSNRIINIKLKIMK